MKSLVSLALRYPEYATQKLKKKVRGKVLAKLDYYFGNGFSMSPTTVSFNLTHICNLRCKMCAQYGQNGIFNNAKKDTIKGVLSINELRGIIDEIAVFKPDIYIWGGEPLLHPNFIDFVEYIKKRNLICVVNTNGTILQRYAHKLVSIGLDSIDLSLDGPQQMHDKIRGVPGTFKKVIAGLEAILMAKNDNLNSKPFIKLVTVITEDNYEFLEQVVQIARNYNIDYMELAYGWSVSQKMGEMTDKIFESNFQCGATSWKGFLTDCHKLDVQKLKKILQKIKNKNNNGLYINFIPNIDMEDIDEYYRNPSYLPLQKRCVSPWMRADIRPDGDVTPCSSFPDYIAGNIRKEGFMEIWNGQRLKKFRQVLRKNKIFPVCSRCCGLYNY